MQTILGSGGTIGLELAKALKKYTNTIRLASRNPQKVNDDDELISTDLTKPDQVDKAVEGSEVVYLTVGLPYSTKFWRKTWPLIMQNVIIACKKHHAKLVFFDNIYMYDPDLLNPMTEETPIKPSSKKGKVRQKIAQMLLDEAEAGKLKALIARAADFYGPGIKNRSVLTETVFNNLAAGKKANWVASVKYKHSYTYTPDAAKATAILGNTDDAYNQVWHLPTANNPLTGLEWIQTIANALRKEPKYMVISKTFMRIIGLFVPVMGEMVEMMYQYDRDYVFNSSKFVNYFNFQPTAYLEGINAIVAKDYS
jgi:nucleoside-diphosphate-sugar epimerase